MNKMSKEMSKQLAKCPFCGGEAKLMRFPKCERKYVVICENEQCMASVGNYSYSKEKAIEAWNTRTPMEIIVERLEEQREESATDYYDWEDISYLRERDAYQKAIEIVKEEGGMNERN